MRKQQSSPSTAMDGQENIAPVAPPSAGPCVYTYPQPVQSIMKSLDTELVSRVEDIRGALLLSYMRFDTTQRHSQEEAHKFDSELNDMADALFEAKPLFPRIGRSRSGSFCTQSGS